MNAKLRTSILAAAIAALPLGVQAAGLGNIQVKSGLGQPLNAEIEVSAAPAELRQLSARIADMDAFQRANIPYSLLMTEISTSIEQRGKRTYIKLTSAQPVNEPIVDMVIALDWQEGSATREYTFLLDPVEGVSAPAKATAPIVVPPTPTVAPEYSGPRMPQETIRETVIPADGSQPAIPSQPAPAVAPQAPAQPVSAPPAPVARDEDEGAAAASGGDEYRVVRGDTLSAIARRHLAGSGNLDQMLIALLRANPDAFIDGNVNRLRAGAILRLPDADTIEAVDRQEARRQVRAQAADFNSYRNRLAGLADQTAVADSGEGARSSAGSITAPVAPADQSSTGDRVVVSGGMQAADASKDARINALQEELASKEAALQESNQRVSELESMVNDLKKLTTLPVTPPVAEPAAPPTIEAQPPAEPAVVEPAAPEAAPAEAEQSSAAEPATSSEDSSAAQMEETPPAESDSTPPVMEEEPAPVEEPPAEAPIPPAAVEPATPPVEESSSLSTPMLAGGALLLLALIYGISRIRRARQQAEEDEFIDDESGFVDDMSEQQMDDEEEEEEEEQHSSFGVTGGQSVDTSADDAQTDFAQVDSTEEGESGVDPIAEADVYLGYGRAEAAVGILQDAIKADSGRADLYVKLLECYSQLQDADQFGLTATELYTLTGGKGEGWNKAAELGRELDPENPLYQSNAASAAPAAAPAAAAEPAAAPASDALTFDLDMGDSPVSSTLSSPAHNASLERTIVASEEAAAPEAAAEASIGETLDIDLGDVEGGSGENLDATLALPDEKIGFNDAATLASEPDEVDTKLDLARAYSEMGDKEGARELIEEVIREGNAQQQEKARQLQAQLDS